MSTESGAYRMMAKSSNLTMYNVFSIPFFLSCPVFDFLCCLPLKKNIYNKTKFKNYFISRFLNVLRKSRILEKPLNKGKCKNTYCEQL